MEREERDRASPRGEVGRHRRRQDLRVPPPARREVQRRARGHRRRLQEVRRAQLRPTAEFRDGRHVHDRHRRRAGRDRPEGAGRVGHQGDRPAHPQHHHRQAAPLLPGQAHLPLRLRVRPPEAQGPGQGDHRRLGDGRHGRFHVREGRPRPAGFDGRQSRLLGRQARRGSRIERPYMPDASTRLNAYKNGDVDVVQLERADIEGTQGRSRSTRTT